MGNKHPSLKGLNKHRAKRKAAKAKRLANGTPKWKDEKYMNAAQYKAYVDKFLELDDLDEKPNGTQAKIAVSMYDKVMKYEETAQTVNEQEDNAIKAILEKAKRINTQ